jgi:hypothetical protein
MNAIPPINTIAMTTRNILTVVLFKVASLLWDVAV